LTHFDELTPVDGEAPRRHLTEQVQHLALRGCLVRGSMSRERDRSSGLRFAEAQADPQGVEEGFPQRSVGRACAKPVSQSIDLTRLDGIEHVELKLGERQTAIRHRSENSTTRWRN